MADKLGGWSGTKDATDEIQKICDQLKGQVEKKTNKKHDEFKVVKYREQLVAGRKLHIKVHVGGVNYIHLFVFEALPCNGGGVELSDVEQHKTEDDDLD